MRLYLGTPTAVCGVLELPGIGGTIVLRLSGRFERYRGHGGVDE